MFSKLFGSAGSDKADKLRQQAIDAFTSIQTPQLKDLQVALNKYVLAGQLTPEQAEASLLSSNAFNAIVTDPSYVGAQKQALQQLQAIGTQGGLTAIDKAQLNDITNQQNQQNRSQNAATMQQAQMRGVGGSDLNEVNQLINEQGAADRAANSGLGVAAQAQARALQAMQAAGQQGGALEAQTYGEAANKAQAQNAIDVFNKQALNQTNLYNTQTSNAAQAANLANAQAVANANTATGNANKEYNAQQNQQVFNDALQKAQGVAGTETSWANDAQRQAENERNASAGFTSDVVNKALSAFGGAPILPSGMNAPTDMASSSTPGSTNSNYKRNPNGSYNFAYGGEVDHPDHPDHMAMGGHIHCYAHGETVSHHPDCYMSKGGFLGDLKKGALHKDLGVPSDKSIPSGKLEKATHSDNETLRKRAQFAENAKHWHHGKDGGEVPGEAEVEGDSPKNDTVDAKLSPGEIVIPRSAAQDDEEFDKFMEKFRPSNQHKMAKGGRVPLSIPRVADTNPMRDTVHPTAANPVPLAATNDASDFSQMMNKFKPKKLKSPAGLKPEASALANLHARVSHLEGRPI